MNNRNRLALALGLMVGLAGCGAPVTDRVRARLPAVVYQQPMACGACVAEWQRAQLWLATHSAWKLQLVTDVILQTYSPMNSQPSYGFTLTKVPDGAGGFKIGAALMCGNMLGCDPLPGDVTQAMLHYIATGQDVLVGAGYLSAIR